MNAMQPNCLDDFLLSNPSERRLLELILSRKMPFPFNGKSGILLHGVWGTGKSTLATLLPDLFEAAYGGEWDISKGVGALPAADPSHTITEVIRCGGVMNSTQIAQKITASSQKMPVWHSAKHSYFVFDEVDRLTVGAQQSLRSTMDLPRCMFFFTTNYLGKLDQGIINRCHLIEMNQASTPSAYLPLAHSLLAKMGVAPDALPIASLLAAATRAKGSLRDFTNDVILAGLAAADTV